MSMNSLKKHLGFYRLAHGIPTAIFGSSSLYAANEYLKEAGRKGMETTQTVMSQDGSNLSPEAYLFLSAGLGGAALMFGLTTYMTRNYDKIEDKKEK